MTLSAQSIQHNFIDLSHPLIIRSTPQTSYLESRIEHMTFQMTLETWNEFAAQSEYQLPQLPWSTNNSFQAVFTKF